MYSNKIIVFVIVHYLCICLTKISIHMALYVPSDTELNMCRVYILYYVFFSLQDSCLWLFYWTLNVLQCICLWKSIKRTIFSPNHMYRFSDLEVILPCWRGRVWERRIWPAPPPPASWCVLERNLLSNTIVQHHGQLGEVTRTLNFKFCNLCRAAAAVRGWLDWW